MKHRILEIVLVVFVFIHRGDCQNELQDISSLVDSLSFFAGNVDLPNEFTPEMKMDLLMTEFEKSYHNMKNALSADCMSSLMKIFGPALKYILTKDYPGLIKWMVKTGAVYCK